MTRRPAVEGKEAPDREHDYTEVRVAYDAEVFEDGVWRSFAYNFDDLEDMQRDAETWTGSSAPVPVHRRVVERTTTYYVWGDHEHVESEEERTVVSEHTYDGPADPFHWRDAAFTWKPPKVGFLRQLLRSFVGH